MGGVSVGRQNLVAGDTNGKWDTFVRDRLLGTTERVSVSSTGEQANGSSDRHIQSYPSISVDGRYVVFSSLASNLAPGDDDKTKDAFVRDRVAGRTINVSEGLKGPAELSGWVSISRSGRYVVFESAAHEEDTHAAEETSDIYRHDLITGTTSFITLTRSGSDSFGWLSNVSGDGRSVVFMSHDPRLGPTNGLDNIFVYRVAEGL